MAQAYGSINFDYLFVSISILTLSPDFVFCQVELRYMWYPLDSILLWVHFINNLWYKEARSHKDFWVVKYVRLHWASWQWNYCGTYKFYGNTEIPGEKLFGG